MGPANPTSGMTGVVGHYFMTSVGYFGMLSSLVVILDTQGFSAGQIALLVSAFTCASKVAKVPLAPWLDRISPRWSVLLGCGLAALGFSGLHAGHSLFLTVAALLLAGVGISVNALASKQLAAFASDHVESRATMFSVLNVAVNVSSAVGAPLALWLVDRDLYPWVTYGVAAVYLTAGLATGMTFGKSATPTGVRVAPSWRTYWQVFNLPGMRPFLLVNYFGWFLYGQLFNVLALHVSGTLQSPGRLGWLYTLNALLVITLQLGVTRVSERLHGGRPFLAVQMSYAIYLIAFVAAYLVPGYEGAVVFVVLFSLAEMIFVPRVDVLLLGLIGQDNRAVAYSVLSMSTALGEASGGGFGLMSYRWLSDLGHHEVFWLLAGTLALLFALATRRLTSGAHPPELAPAFR